MPSIRDFSGGVVNQNLQNRDNGSGVVFDCKNVLSSWNGELRKRTGTRWLKNLDEYSRIIPYRLPSGDDVILLFANNKIEAYENAGDYAIKPFYVYSGSAPTFPTSGWDTKTTNGKYTIWLSSDSAQSEWGKGFDTPAQTRPMTYYGKGSHWTGGYGVATNVPAYIQISSTGEQTFNSMQIRWTNSANGNHKGHFKGWLEPTIQYSDDGNNWVSVQTEMTNPVPFGGADYYEGSYYNGTRTENHIVYKVTNVAHITPHKYWRIYCARRITNTSTYDGERIDLNLSDITYLSNSKTALVIDTTGNFAINSDTIDNIRFAQSGTLMILTNGVDKPYYLQYSSGNFNYGKYNMSFDSEQGSPSCVTFFQNRLWFGGFSAHPTRVWGSAFGNFADFTRPATILSTSAIYADAVEIQSRIENLWGGNNALYCLSEDGVSMIDAQGSIVATDQIEFKLRNREPVNGMTPTYKDDIMIYLGRDCKKVLITDFDYVVQRFKAQNISQAYNDFFKSGIRELHYIPDSSSLIYGTLKDGKWFAVLLDLDNGKNALFPFDTNGLVVDVQPVKYEEQTRLLLTVQRDGQWVLEEKTPILFQERMDFMTEDEKKAYTKQVMEGEVTYLDCAVKRVYSEPVSFISDLPFTAGSKVEVIADGTYLGEKQVTDDVVGTLFAWVKGSEVVYTDTPTPVMNSTLYNKDQLEDKAYTIREIGSNTIALEKTITRHYHLYGLACPEYLDTTVGRLNRNESGDKIITSRGGSSSYGINYGGYYVGRRRPDEGDSVLDGAKIVKGYVNTVYGLVTWLTDSQYQNPERSILDFTNIRSSDGSIMEDEYQIMEINDVPQGNVSSPTYVKEYYLFDGTGTYHKFYISPDDDLNWDEEYGSISVFTRSPENDIAAIGIGLRLDGEYTTVVAGYKYDSYSVIKFVSPYNMRKFPKEVSVNFINTGYLEMGNTFDTLKSVLNNLVESVSITNEEILMNGNYTKTLAKQTFETPYVIVRSDKGLPFIITGMDYKVDMSNYQGGV